MPSGYSSRRSTHGRKVVAAQLPGPCTRCGGIVTADMNWQADHIIQRTFAEAAGWTEAQIDAPSNLGLAHASCNARANKRVTSKAKASVHVPRVNRPKFGEKSVFLTDEESPGEAHLFLSLIADGDTPQEAQDGF